MVPLDRKKLYVLIGFLSILIAIVFVSHLFIIVDMQAISDFSLATGTYEWKSTDSHIVILCKQEDEYEITVVEKRNPTKVYAHSCSKVPQRRVCLWLNNVIFLRRNENIDMLFFRNAILDDLKVTHPTVSFQNIKYHGMCFALKEESVTNIIAFLSAYIDVPPNSVAEAVKNLFNSDIERNDSIPKKTAIHIFSFTNDTTQNLVIASPNAVTDNLSITNMIAYIKK